MLSQQDTQRYSRQIMLDEIGYEGQIKLGNATATVVGAGGLGTPILQRLASMGVGNIRIVDRDTIDLTNLHRQILYRDDDIGEPKVEVAAKRLREMNPSCNVVAIPVSVNNSSAPDIVKGSDVVIDALDSVAARYALNTACIDQSIPFVTGGAVGVSGQVFTVLPGSACYNCIFPGLSDDMVPSCGIEGVHPAILGMVSSIEVAEAIAVLTGNKPALQNRMLHVDMSSMAFTHTSVKRVPECGICGDEKRRVNKTTELVVEELCGRDMGKRTFAVTPPHSIQLNKLLSRVESKGDTGATKSAKISLDVHSKYVIESKSDMGATILVDSATIQIMEGGAAIIVGAKDEDDVRSTYSKLIAT